MTSLQAIRSGEKIMGRLGFGCDLLEELAPQKPVGVQNYRDLITFVEDRPGHDLRYAIDATKIQRELGWAPEETFETGLRKTVEWYLSNRDWCARIQDGSYQRERLGAAVENHP